MTLTLAYGLSAAIPATVATAWGARLIFPDDLLPDRQDLQGDDRAELVAWLNGKAALRKALTRARTLSEAWKLSRDGAQRVTLYRDDLGVVVACPNNSHGYLYVAAWLHHGDEDKQPAGEFAAD